MIEWITWIIYFAKKLKTYIKKYNIYIKQYEKMKKNEIVFKMPKSSYIYIFNKSWIDL